MTMEEGREVKEEYTQDGTVNLKGKPVLRSKTGGWKACSFIVVYEVFERMAYYGISSNLILYLTKKLHQGTVTASNNVTNWVGTIWITPILGAYVADAHLGRFWTFLIASTIYLSGMSLLTLAVSLPTLKPPQCLDIDVTKCKKASTLQLAVFYGALYILAIGTGGTKPNISTIGADQFDDFHPKEKSHKLSFFNWWMFSIFFGTLFANTVLVYVQDSVGWTLGYALPTLGLAISIVIFLSGTPFYRHKLPAGSTFTRMARVIVAALRKWKVNVPHDTKELYELDMEEYAKKGSNTYRIDSTPTLRFLDKACVKTGSTSPWMLCTVTHVEETKQMLRMIPILVATFVPSTMMAQINTLFVKQGTTLDRHFGSFKIPPASLGAFVTLSLLVCVVLYDRFFVKIMQKLTKNPRGITLLQRMGIGLVIHTITQIHSLSAALVGTTQTEPPSLPISDSMEANEVGTNTRDEFAGFIFMCNRITKPECYRYRVFALPAGRKHIVERINPGTYLFLFDTDVKLLYGTYLATSPGMLNIQPSAFGGRFPAQVSFKIHQDCLPLPESHFKHAIKDNYQNHSNKFNPELNIGQVRNLLEMFRPLHPMSTAPTHPVLNGVHSASTLQLPPVNSVFHQSSRASLSEDSFLHRMSPSQAIRLLSQKYLNGREEPTGWANSVAAQSVPSQASRNPIHALASTDTAEGAYATGTVSSYTPSLPYRQYARQNNVIGHAQSMQNYQHAQLNVLHPQPQFHASVMTAGSNHSYGQSLQYSQQAYLNVSHPPPEYHSSTMTNNSYTQSLQDPQQSILNPPPPGVHPPAANVDSNHAQMLWYPHGTHQNIQNLQPGYYPSAVNVSSSYAQSFQDPQYTHQQAQNLQPGYGSSVNMDHSNAVMQSHASSSLYYPYVHQQVISGTYAVQGSAPIGSEYYQPSMPTE